MCVCSLDGCNNKCFEKEDRCILHCKKDENYEYNDFDKYLDSSIKLENEKVVIKKVVFPFSSSYEKILNKYDDITFIGCIFLHELRLKYDMKIRFSHCTFKNEWKHIICEKIEYSKCIFDKFIYYSNIGTEKDISKDSTLFDCTFNSIDCEGVVFKKPFIQIVDEKKAKHIDEIKLVRCEFEDDFILKVSDNSNRDELVEIKFNSIDLTDSIFHKKFKMQYCSVENESIFYNTQFKDLADFYRTKFNEVIFERTDFEKVSVFSEVEFNSDINFKYAKFIKKSIFRDTVISGALDLRNSIFDDEANFLDITSEKRKKINGEFYGEPKEISVSNRETARIIKNFYDNSNNIIEANKFYALEMKEREKELSKENMCNNIMEWIVFKAHSIASNHSQDYILPVLWILNLALFMSMSTSTFYHNNMLAYMSAFVMFVSSLKINKVSLLKVVLALNFIIFYFLSYVHLDGLANLINPFSVMTGKETLTFGLLIYKVTIAYLIYQFIISIRQNTRRK